MFRLIQCSALILAALILGSWAAWIAAQDAGQKSKPLTEADIVGLIGLQTDDGPILKRLANGGIAFTMDEATLNRIKQANPSPEVLAALAKLVKTKTKVQPKIVEQPKI